MVASAIKQVADSDSDSDDAVFLAHSKTIKLLEKEMNQEVKFIYDWLITNKLTLNYKKTKYMIFQNKRDPKIKKKNAKA